MGFNFDLRKILKMDNNPKDKALGSMNALESMLERNVQIVTSDGRIFVGKILIIFEIKINYLLEDF